MTLPDTSNFDNMLDIALAAIDAGFAVILIKPGTKQPHTAVMDPRGEAPKGQGGFHLETRDKETARVWWTLSPESPVATRPGSGGCVVTDVDRPEGKRRFWQEAALNGMDLFSTCITDTPGKDGGIHVWTDRTGINGIAGNAVIPEVGEQRGDNGYILLPGSYHPNGGRYTMSAKSDFEVMPVPQWLIDKGWVTFGGTEHSDTSEISDADALAWMEECSSDGDGGEVLEDAIDGLLELDGREGERHPGMLRILGTLLNDIQNGRFHGDVQNALSEFGETYGSLYSDERLRQRRMQDFTRAVVEFVKVRVAEDAEEVWVPPEPKTKSQRSEDDRLTRLRKVTTFTDTDNAERLVIIHGAEIRYVALWKRWITWDGQSWDLKAGDIIVKEKAKDVGRHLYTEYKAAKRTLGKHDDCVKALKAGARRAASNAAINAMVDLAKGINGIHISHDDLDTDPWLFGVQNGVVDLKTGIHTNGRAEDLMHMQAGVEYDSAAECPTFDQCLVEWFPNPETRRFVQRLSGSALVGRQKDHVFTMDYGGGGNGKGTFTRAHQFVFGDYFVVPHKSLLVVAKYDQHDTVRAVLFRRRLAVASETDKRVKINEASVKNLTGGDRITARRMREDLWEFDPSHSLRLQTNYLPEISGQDSGIWDRIRVVPWVSSFRGTPMEDTNLDEKLAAEGSGILNWLIEGCLEWQRIGLNEPPEVLARTAAYRSEEDILGQFAADVGLVFGDDLEIDFGTITELLDDWVEVNHIHPSPNRNDVITWLGAKGAVSVGRKMVDGRRLFLWRGIGVEK